MEQIETPTTYELEEAADSDGVLDVFDMIELGFLPQEARHQIDDVVKARTNAHSRSDDELIAEALAEGRYRVLSACIDSNGHDHLNGKGLNPPRRGFAGAAYRLGRGNRTIKRRW